MTTAAPYIISEATTPDVESQTAPISGVRPGKAAAPSFAPVVISGKTEVAGAVDWPISIRSRATALMSMRATLPFPSHADRSTAGLDNNWRWWAIVMVSSARQIIPGVLAVVPPAASRPRPWFPHFGTSKRAVVPPAA